MRRPAAYQNIVDAFSSSIYTGTGGQRDPYQVSQLIRLVDTLLAERISCFLQGDNKHVGDQSFEHPSNASLLVFLTTRSVFNLLIYFLF